MLSSPSALRFLMFVESPLQLVADDRDIALTGVVAVPEYIAEMHGVADTVRIPRDVPGLRAGNEIAGQHPRDPIRRRR